MKIFLKVVMATVCALPMVLFGAGSVPQSSSERSKDPQHQRFHDPYADPDEKTYEGMSEGSYLPAIEEDLAEPHYTQEEWDRATKPEKMEGKNSSST